MSAIEDKKFALSGDKTCNWRAEEILRSAEFRKEYASRPNVVAGRGHALGTLSRRADQASDQS